MTDPQRRTRTAIVTLPREIDIANAADVYAKLFAAVQPDTKVVIADLTSTSFCDSAGIGHILRARLNAIDAGAEFRMVVPAGGVLRVLRVQGLDRVLQPYQTLLAALDRLGGGGIHCCHIARVAAMP